MQQNVALGVMAYNEEANIDALLESVLAQTAGSRLSSIIVVASGCTDGTCDKVRGFAGRDPRVRLIEEPARRGKVNAINRFLKDASEEIAMISGADIVLRPDTLARLLAPFDDPEVGMVGAHSVPVDSSDDFFGFAVNMMWELHHRVSLRDPKMGELVAFRNVFRRLNPSAICDELSVHQLIRSAGYRAVYAPDAIVLNKGPETLREFVSQRMHCIVGNLEIMQQHNVPVSTMRALSVAAVALPYASEHWRKLHWVAGAAAIEIYCRMRARLARPRGEKRERQRVWEPIRSSKTAIDAEIARKVTRAS